MPHMSSGQVVLTGTLRDTGRVIDVRRFLLSECGLVQLELQSGALPLPRE